MNLTTLQDSRGKPSTTLFLVMASWLAITVVFLWVSISKQDASHIGEYGAAALAILAAWLGREGMDKGVFARNPQ